VTQRIRQLQWALARIVFILYIGFSVVSLVGGFLTAPLMTWYFFGDWRFWRHWSAGLGLWRHAMRLLRLMMSDRRGFMFSVPLTSPPRTRPDPDATTLHRLWPHGASCGDCSNCCRPGGYACPLLDEVNERCRGYDSFYWRYFNCGRFPSVEAEIDYYGCGKWVLNPAPGAAEPVTVSLAGLTSELREIRYKALRSEVTREAGRWTDEPPLDDGVPDLIARPVPPAFPPATENWRFHGGDRPSG
jgi:hypothetical protein